MENTNCFYKIALRIIQEQESIIGPLAWTEAKKVSGLQVVNQEKGELIFQGEPKEIIDRLVSQYEKIFGKASRAVCKESVQDIIADIPVDQMPLSLK